MEMLALSWIEVLLVLLGLIGISFVVKIAISFDINAWVRNRAEDRKNRLPVLCPHTEISPTAPGQLEVRSLFHSPPGTITWICSRCGLQTPDSDLPPRLTKYYGENPNVWLNADKKFRQLARKIYKT